MSRRVYLLGVGLALVALALAFTDWVIGPTPGVTEANVRRIREGMAAKQVEAILGKPNWCGAGFPGRGSPPEDRYQILGSPMAVWFWETGSNERVMVHFDEAGLVVRVGHSFEAGAARTSLLNRLRAWLGW
jgi:hypothetical protein